MANDNRSDLIILSVIPKRLQWMILVLIAFCYLYAFNLPLIKNSIVLAALALPILLAVSNRVFNLFIYLTGTATFKMLLLSYCGFFILATLSTVINWQMDFTIVPTIINNVISLFLAAALVSIVKSLFPDKSILSLFVWLLVLQALAILVMLLAPPIKEAIQALIRSDAEIARMSVYGGIRGLGIAGSVAFGLSVTLAFLGFFLHIAFLTNLKQTPRFIKFTIFGLCFIASLTAGRTAAAGYLLGFAIHPFLVNKAELSKAVLTYSVYSLLLIAAIATYILTDPVLRELALSYSAYAFQFAINLVTEGDASTSSLNKLQSMYFVPFMDNLWLGDGQYTNPDGTYYQHTDAGYMRFLLLTGVLGSAFIYFMFCLFIMTASKEGNTKKYPLTGVGFLIAVLAFVLHYKGEVILHSVPAMKILAMFFLYNASEKPLSYA